jgi:hypothetical protein
MIRISKAGRWFATASLIWLTFSSAVLGDQLTPVSRVTLGWNASSDPTVVGYCVYSGTSAGTYTNRIDVGTNTTFTITGLPVGPTNYFAATSYNSAGVESVMVTEFSFVVPEILSLTQNPTNGVMRVQFPVFSGQSYQLQASSNLVSWSNIWLTPIQTTNGWIEYDEPFTNTPSARFYRLILY